MYYCNNLTKGVTPLLDWDHINQSGDCLWRSSAKIGEGKFRPLRSLHLA